MSKIIGSSGETVVFVAWFSYSELVFAPSPLIFIFFCPIYIEEQSIAHYNIIQSWPHKILLWCTITSLLSFKVAD